MKCLPVHHQVSRSRVPDARSVGASNVAFTRMDEIKSGVKIADADGNVVGISKAAGKQAVMQTVTARVLERF